MTITYKAIHERIEETAKEIVGEIPFPEKSSFETWQEYESCLEEMRDSLSHEKAWESVDSWDWCIYTYKGFQVFDALDSSDQSEAESLFEDAGGYYQAIDQQMGPYEIGCQMAYYWLVNKLNEAIQEECDKLIELASDEMIKEDS